MAASVTQGGDFAASCAKEQDGFAEKLSRQHGLASDLA